MNDINNFVLEVASRGLGIVCKISLVKSVQHENEFVFTQVVSIVHEGVEYFINLVITKNSDNLVNEVKTEIKRKLAVIDSLLKRPFSEEHKHFIMMSLQFKCESIHPNLVKRVGYDKFSIKVWGSIKYANHKYKNNGSFVEIFQDCMENFVSDKIPRELLEEVVV